MPRARLQDVADHAGVSLATASRVLNGSARQPGPDLVDRVRAAAAVLGYVVNAQAQALARSRTGLLGLVVQDVTDPSFALVAAGAQAAAREHGRLLLLFSTDHDPAAERDAVAAFAGYRVDALVLAGTGWSVEGDAPLAAEVAAYQASGGRVVVVGQPWGTADVVRPPDAEGAGALAAALVAQGHRRFVLLGMPDRAGTARVRTEAFAAAVTAAGAEVVGVVAAELSRDGGFAAGDRVAELARVAVAEGLDAPCVFAGGDVAAVGLVARLRELGLTVPDDVAVAGFDDVPVLRDHAPSLSTLHVPLAELGRLAVEVAVSADTGRRVAVGHRVVLRESTAR